MAVHFDFRVALRFAVAVLIFTGLLACSPVGGPIKRDNTFYEASFERQNFVNGLPQQVMELSLDYQAAAIDLLNNPNGIYGNYAPIAVNPVSLKLPQTLWPSSALNGPAAPENYFNPGFENGFVNNGVIRLDHSFS
jgi:hypothetical protein